MKYTIQHDGEAYEFDLLSPFDALVFVFHFLRDAEQYPEDEARPELLKAYEMANIALGNKELTRDQEALLSLFFAMGLQMGKEVTTYPQLELTRAAAIAAKEARSKGGRNSYWKPYQEIIEKHVAAHIQSRAVTAEKAIDEIKQDTGHYVPEDTFRSWVRRYKKEGAILK